MPYTIFSVTQERYVELGIEPMGSEEIDRLSPENPQVQAYDSGTWVTFSYYQ